MLDTIAISTIVAQKPIAISFHVARDPEFLQGVQDGRALLSQQGGPAHDHGWWSVDDLLHFVSTELSSESLTTTRQQHTDSDTAPFAPIYNLGLVAGLFGMLAEQATTSNERTQPAQDTFRINHSAFLSGMQQGVNLYQQEQGGLNCLTDLTLLKFYQDYLTPFAFDPIGQTGVLLGWMRAFLASGARLDCSSTSLDFLAGYHIASQDWHAWKKDELLTDVGFAECLANELSPETQATMQSTEPWYTEPYQIGYAFGLVHGLLSSLTIQVIERPYAQSEKP